MRALVILALASGCAALPDDGALQCNADPAHACPDGFQCAADNRCYRVGHAPPAGADMATGGDMNEPPSCADSSACPVSAPVCAEQACSACGTVGMSTECATHHAATPLCGPSGACVECFTKDQCDAKHQTCDLTTYSCAPCTAHDQCTSGYCNIATGICADKSTQLYVNNAPTAGCTDGGAGSFAVPFCTIGKAMNTSAVNGGKTVVVFGGTYAETLQLSPAAIGNKDYTTTAVGIGKPIIQGAGAAPVLQVAGVSGIHTTVSLDGFVFDGAGITDGSPVVDVTGQSTTAYAQTTLTLSHAAIRSGPAVGLLADMRSRIIVDAIDVYGNKGGGVRVDSVDFAVTNTLIRSNGSTTSSFAGFSLLGPGEAGKMTLANLTIVSNMTAPASTLSSGLGCLAPPSSVINTVIIGNSGGPGEVDPACGTPFTGDAFVGAPAGNENLPAACMLTDLFANPGNADYHPKKGGATPCTLVDEGTENGAPDHDSDGNARPAGGTVDVGAYEAK